jgi:hypothetical protein
LAVRRYGKAKGSGLAPVSAFRAWAWDAGRWQVSGIAPADSVRGKRAPHFNPEWAVARERRAAEAVDEAKDAGQDTEREAALAGVRPGSEVPVTASAAAAMVPCS